MNKKYEVFFGEKGLTMTSANHIANKAKEMIRLANNYLDNVSFVDEQVSLLSGVGNAKLIRTGMKATETDVMFQQLEDAAKAKALMAWLREAIVAKEATIDELECARIETWAEENGKVMPVCPVPPTFVTEDDILAEMNIGTRNQYYDIEAKVSTYGKFIHDRGRFALARKEAMDSDAVPTSVTGSGTDAMVYERTLSIPVHDIEHMFMVMFNKHRELQAEFNKMKHKIETEVNNRNIDLKAEYNMKNKQYLADSKVLNDEFELWRQQELKRVRDLKIIIPEKLRTIYETVNNM